MQPETRQKNCSMSHKKRLTIIVGILACFAVLMFIDMQRVRKEPANNLALATSKLSTDVWSITFTDIDGNIVPLTTFMGVPVVLQSWSTSCLFCTQEMTKLVEYQKEFSNSIKFVAINRAEPVEKVVPFLQAHDPNQQIHQLLDEGDLFYSAIGAVTEPETLFISADGDIVLQAQGPISDQEIRETLAKMQQ